MFQLLFSRFVRIKNSIRFSIDAHKHNYCVKFWSVNNKPHETHRCESVYVIIEYIKSYVYFYKNRKKISVEKLNELVFVCRNICFDWWVSSSPVPYFTLRAKIQTLFWSENSFIYSRQIGWKPYIMSHFQIQLKPFEMFCSSIVDTLCDQTLHFIEFKFKLNFRSTTNRKICMNNWAKLVLFRMKSCYNRNYKTNHYLPHTVWVAVFNKIYCHIFPVLSTLKLSIQ